RCLPSCARNLSASRQVVGRYKKRRRVATGSAGEVKGTMPNRYVALLTQCRADQAGRGNRHRPRWEACRKLPIQRVAVARRMREEMMDWAFYGACGKRALPRWLRLKSKKSESIGGRRQHLDSSV